MLHCYFGHIGFMTLSTVYHEFSFREKQGDAQDLYFIPTDHKAHAIFGEVMYT